MHGDGRTVVVGSEFREDNISSGKEIPDGKTDKLSAHAMEGVKVNNCLTKGTGQQGESASLSRDEVAVLLEQSSGPLQAGGQTSGIEERPVNQNCPFAGHVVVDYKDSVEVEGAPFEENELVTSMKFTNSFKFASEDKRSKARVRARGEDNVRLLAKSAGNKPVKKGRGKSLGGLSKNYFLIILELRKGRERRHSVWMILAWIKKLKM